MARPGEDEPLPQYSVFGEMSYHQIIEQINKVQKYGNEKATGKEDRIKTKHEVMLDQIAEELKL